MPTIEKLPEALIRLIAAGEVIERPASVVKELVENSLDAGASRVTVQLWGAGRQRIRVSDDGKGMSRADAALALERHATSKLKSFDDLHALATFGFRGEALPSIAAVSRLTLTTRTKDEAQGWHLQLEGGRLLATEAVGVPVGTTLEVADLFFNTPVRSKFMKKDSTERTYLLKTLQEIALVHPDVAFHIEMDGKNVLALAPSRELGERIGELWGLSVTEKLVGVAVKQGPCRLTGFVNAIPAHHPTKAYQALFVNKRPVQQRLLTHAIYEAYHEWLPIGRHPIFALFIEIDPSEIDVNVHPTKREVRFANERAVYDLLFSQIRSLFRTSQSTQRGDDVFRASQDSSPVRPTLQEVGAAIALFEPLSAPAQQGELGSTGAFPEHVADAPPRATFSTVNLRILGQFQKLYLLAEQGSELLLIDQHAAAERVYYERLLAEARRGPPARHRLLTPFIWELTAARAETVRSWQDALDTLGFSLENFGPHTFALKEWPAAFPELRQAKRFLEILVESLEDELAHPAEEAHHEAVARAACRAAIKANDPLALPEMTRLLEELAGCERPMTCPHGRPTHIRLPITELHRRFGRT